MRKRINTVCLILVVFLSACEKENSELILSNNSGLLAQVFFDSELYEEYSYNASDQIVE